MRERKPPAHAPKPKSPRCLPRVRIIKRTMEFIRGVLQPIHSLRSQIACRQIHSRLPMIQALLHIHPQVCISTASFRETLVVTEQPTHSKDICSLSRTCCCRLTALVRSLPFETHLGTATAILHRRRFILITQARIRITGLILLLIFGVPRERLPPLMQLSKRYGSRTGREQSKQQRLRQTPYNFAARQS